MTVHAFCCILSCVHHRWWARFWSLAVQMRTQPCARWPWSVQTPPQQRRWPSRALRLRLAPSCRLHGISKVPGTEEGNQGTARHITEWYDCSLHETVTHSTARHSWSTWQRGQETAEQLRRCSTYTGCAKSDALFVHLLTAGTLRTLCGQSAGVCNKAGHWLSPGVGRSAQAVLLLHVVHM